MNATRLSPPGGSPAPYQRPLQSGEGTDDSLAEDASGDTFSRFSITSILVWGRAVPDISDFCRELVAALAEG